MNPFNYLRSSKPKALKGRPIVARGKCESESAPPRVRFEEFQPLTAKPRDSAKLICGIHLLSIDIEVP